MANTPDQTSVGGAMSLYVQAKSAVTVSSLLMTCVLLAVLQIKQATKADEVLGVGDPSAETIISGVKIDGIKAKQLMQFGGYSPLEDAVDQRDWKRETLRDTPVQRSAIAVTGTAFTWTVTTLNGVITAVTFSGGTTTYTGALPTLVVVDAAGSTGYGAVLRPVMAAGAISSVTVINGGQGYASTGANILVNAGLSAGEKFDRPFFRYAGIEHTGYMYDSDINAAKALLTQAVNLDSGAEVSVLDTEMKRVLGQQAVQICDDLWYGVPSDQTQPFWDQPSGLLQAIDDSNTYGGIDRTALNNYWWKGKKDTANHTFTAEGLINDMLYTKGLQYLGGGPDIVVVSSSLFQKFISDATARTQIVDLCADGKLKQFGEYGFTGTALKYGAVSIIPDNRCQPGTVLGLNSRTILIPFMNGKKFAPSEIKDGKTAFTGGFDGSYFFMNTQWMPIIENPALCVKYTSVF